MGTEHLTRCPHCASVFRLRPEQLPQARGWLRCGQCQQAFDANDRVLNWQPVGSPAAAVPEERLDLEALLRSEDPSVQPRSTPTPSPSPALSEGVLDFEQALASFARPQPVWPTDGAVPVVPTRAAVTRASRWWLALLLVLLLTQAAWTSRALWAPHWPALGHGVQAACERLACVLLPWREPRVLAIAHAHLARTDGGHALQWVLDNRVAWPLHTPSVELTLLDASEQVLVRRVWSPAEAHLPPVLAPQQQLLAQLAWAWPDDAPTVAAYRLIAFYP